ncbi:MAG TPA: hypothetical protein VD836_13005 [Solirubrobacteraceae bacterium]|nr:hypothetical protein [Solirubrobacteraceae bacterium]
MTRLILATLLALALHPAAALAAPEVTTGAADPVGETAATLNGTVDPNGEETSYAFEYGTTTEYGLTTEAQTVPAGDEPVPVTAELIGLSAATTYHYRLVSGDVVQGADATFTTAAGEPQPALPEISARGYTERQVTSVTLKARIDPNRAATTYAVEWGYSESLGQSTPEQELPAGDEPVAVRFPLSGLTPYTRVYWRVVATNAAGTKRSTTLTVRTRRGPTAITAAVSDGLASWGENVTVSGHVDGAGIQGMTVALEQRTFPYLAPFAAVATARVNSAGDFRFRARQALIGTQWRAVTRSAVVLTSAETATRVRPRLATRVTRSTRRAVRLKGTVNPGVLDAVATLQRLTSTGRWTSVKRKTVTTIDVLRSTATFKVNRKRRARTFRIKVKPASEAYVPVKGSAIRVSRRARG